jgi:hypothetical protein
MTDYTLRVTVGVKLAKVFETGEPQSLNQWQQRELYAEYRRIVYATLDSHRKRLVCDYVNAR